MSTPGNPGCRAIAWSAITRFSLEEDQMEAAANSRASAFKQSRSFHLIFLKAYASGSYWLHAIALIQGAGHQLRPLALTL